MKRLGSAILASLLVALIWTQFAQSDTGDAKSAEFKYARIRYHLSPYQRYRGEVPWHHDYPYGDELFSSFVEKVTRVSTASAGFQIVDIDSKELFKYPFAYMCEPGYLELLPDDVKNLREYLDRGGFILVDDFRQRWTLENLIVQMKKVYPDREIVPLELEHEIFHTFYDMKTLNVRPPYGNEPVEFLALKDPHGNIQMIVNYNNDLSEYWEWIDRGEMPLRQAVESLQFAVNYLVYSFSH